MTPREDLLRKIEDDLRSLKIVDDDDPVIEPAPIHAEIEATCKALRALDRHDDELDRRGEDPDCVSDALMELVSDSFKKIAQTVPTTAAGMAAKIAFVKEAPVPNPFVLDGEEILLAAF